MKHVFTRVTRLSLFCCVALAFACQLSVCLAQESNAAPAPLRRAIDALALPASEAGKRLPVEITGTVTAAEPGWKGQFFVQDGTAGIFVENLSANQPLIGDVVSIKGVTHPGAFAPIISSPVWEKIATSPLPEPKVVSIESLEAGLEDSQRIQISGVVRRASFFGTQMLVELSVGRYRLLVYARAINIGSPQALIGARVTARGTAATDYNVSLRHLTSVAVYVPRPEDFVIDETEKLSPFSEKAIPLTDVAQYRHSSRAGKRIHVAGTVIMQRPGEDLFLQDSTGGLRIRCPDTGRFSPGDSVDAAGFLEFEGFLPLLEDAEVRLAEKTRGPVVVRSESPSEVINGLHHSEMISLRGRILDHTSRRFSRSDGSIEGIRSTWLIQGEGLTFTMEKDDEGSIESLPNLAIGSLILAKGVCLSEASRDGKLKALTLLLPDTTSVIVLENPSWFTPSRLVTILILACVVLTMAIAWSVTLSRKNIALRTLMKEREEARKELQEAHDTLEEKVRERTEQLKVEITARKSSELQFKGVLAERTRLARDLHDSLEQTLTGISLQLDTSSRLFAQSPENAHRHLQLARNWIRQSQVELHRSIWDLRSRELERFDLANALGQSARHVFEGTNITFRMDTLGATRPLPEIVEENILRIAQEALTNVIKHAEATEVSLQLEFAPDLLTLRVRDNGKGGIHEIRPTLGDNHFGLLGMSERAKRLTGRFHIDSSPGKGTQILVEVPLEPAPPPATPSNDLHA